MNRRYQANSKFSELGFSISICWIRAGVAQSA